MRSNRDRLFVNTGVTMQEYQGRSQEFHLGGGINFNFGKFAKVHTGTISNLSWAKEKKKQSVTT